jgi:hypothetical protein
LEKNYQVVKSSSVYADKNYKEKIDQNYNETKNYLKTKALYQSNASNSNNNDFWDKAGV